CWRRRRSSAVRRSWPALANVCETPAPAAAPSCWGWGGRASASPARWRSWPRWRGPGGRRGSGAAATRGEAARPYGPFAEALSEYARRAPAETLRADLGLGAAPLARVAPEL